MKTLEDFRNDYAKEKHYDNWNDFFYRATAKAIEKGYDIVAERFANAKAKALLEEAAEKMPTDDEIEAGGKEGGLRDNELQLYWEGGTEWRNKVRDIFLSLIPKDTTKD